MSATTDTRQFVRSRRRNGYLNSWTLHYPGDDGQPVCYVTLKDPVMVELTAKEFSDGYWYTYQFCWQCQSGRGRPHTTTATVWLEN